MNYALEPPLMVSSLQRPLSCPGGQSIQRLLFKPLYNGNGHYSVPNHPLSLNSGHFFKQPMNSENQDSSCRFLIAVSRLSIPYLFWYEPFFFLEHSYKIYLRLRVRTFLFCSFFRLPVLIADLGHFYPANTSLVLS